MKYLNYFIIILINYKYLRDQKFNLIWFLNTFHYYYYYYQIFMINYYNNFYSKFIFVYF